jgi:uncharacterized protein (TIGR02147 family)
MFGGKMDTEKTNFTEADAAPTSPVTQSPPAPVAHSAGTAKMPAIVEAPAVGDYLDFRKFLAAYYNYRREISKNDIRPYNYGVFSAGADIKSPNYLKMIIEGRRNLSPEMIGKFAKALGLNKEQTEEFRILVMYGQASDPAERNMHLKELNEFRVSQKLKSGEIDSKTWAKVPTWVIFAATEQEGMSANPQTLRKILRDKASVDEIESALNNLLESGELVKDETTGELKRARQLMENSEEISVAMIRKLQSELMYLGLESLYQDSATEREFGSATLSLTKAEFDELRLTLRKIRKDAQKNTSVARANSKGERVYQLNLQLFPVTNPASK